MVLELEEARVKDCGQGCLWSMHVCGSHNAQKVKIVMFHVHATQSATTVKEVHNNWGDKNDGIYRYWLISLPRIPSACSLSPKTK